MHERGAVVCVSEGGGTRVLEKLGETRRPTRMWTVVVVPATQLVGTVRLAPALAPDHRPVTRRRPQLQLGGACGEQIRAAAHDGTDAFAFVWGHRQRDVEPVDEGHSVGGEVLGAVVEAELGQRGGRRSAEAVAFEAVAAVACGAVEVAVAVGAAGSGPDPARPVLGRGGEGAVGQAVECKPALFEDRVAGVGLDAGPDRVGAIVD